MKAIIVAFFLSTAVAVAAMEDNEPAEEEPTLEEPTLEEPTLEEPTLEEPTLEERLDQLEPRVYGAYGAWGDTHELLQKTSLCLESYISGQFRTWILDPLSPPQLVIDALVEALRREAGDLDYVKYQRKDLCYPPRLLFVFHYIYVHVSTQEQEEQALKVLRCILRRLPSKWSEWMPGKQSEMALASETLDRAPQISSKSRFFYPEPPLLCDTDRNNIYIHDMVDCFKAQQTRTLWTPIGNSTFIVFSVAAIMLLFWILKKRNNEQKEKLSLK